MVVTNREAGRIDFHTHFLPEVYLDGLRDSGIDKSGGVDFPDWSPELHRSFMDKHGIQTSVVSISEPGIHFGDDDDARDLARDVNHAAADLVSTDPSRFGAFAVLPLPDVDGAIDELEYALDDLDLDGVVLLSNFNGTYLGNPKLDPVLKKLDNRDTTVFLHPSAPERRPEKEYDAFLYEFTFDTTRAVVNLLYSGALERYSDISWILSHAGGTVPFLAFRFTRLLARYPELKERVPAGIDSYLEQLYYDTAIADTPAQMAATMEVAGTDQIVFGSDWPFASYYEDRGEDPNPTFTEFFDEAQRSKIDRKNGLRLLPRLA